jgi:hypothetical protein
MSSTQDHGKSQGGITRRVQFRIEWKGFRRIFAQSTVRKSRKWMLGGLTLLIAVAPNVTQQRAIAAAGYEMICSWAGTTDAELADDLNGLIFSNEFDHQICGLVAQYLEFTNPNVLFEFKSDCIGKRDLADLARAMNDQAGTAIVSVKRGRVMFGNSTANLGIASRKFLA